MNNKKIIPIFFASDNNYIPFLGTAIKSLLDNASKEYFYNIHVLYTDINDANMQRIYNLETENSKIYFKDLTKNVERIRDRLGQTLRDYYTESIFYRIFIASLFPEYDKAIYLDCDVIVIDDISKMYNLDIGNNIFGVITDDVINSNPQFITYATDAVGVEKYFNSGVLLMNLKEYKAQKIQERFVYMLVKYKFETAAPDQDYLNVLCENKVQFLEKGWDRMPIGDYDGELHIIHYNNFKKPWFYDDVMYGDKFWEYAQKTDFFNEIKSMHDNFTADMAQMHIDGAQKLVKQTIDILNSERNFKKVLKG